MTCRMALMPLTWLLAAGIARADMRNCALDLTDVENAASEASTAADSVADAKDALDDAKDDYHTCRLYPDIYDLLEDGCSSQRQEYDSALDEYNDAVHEYNSAMDSLAQAIKGLRISCSG